MTLLERTWGRRVPSRTKLGICPRASTGLSLRLNLSVQSSAHYSLPLGHTPSLVAEAELIHEDLLGLCDAGCQQRSHGSRKTHRGKV